MMDHIETQMPDGTGSGRYEVKVHGPLEEATRSAIRAGIEIVAALAAVDCTSAQISIGVEDRNGATRKELKVAINIT